MIVGLIAGFVIGFIFSMPPLGPTYFAIIDRSLQKQVKNATAIGIGAGFMDMIYILIAYGGVTAVISLLPESVNKFFLRNEDNLKIYLGIAGCIVVIIYGIKIMKTKSEHSGSAENIDDEKFRQRYEKVESVVRKTEKGIDKILHTKALEDINTDLTGSFVIGIVMCLSSVTLPASWFATVGYLKSYRVIDSNFVTGLLLGVGVLLGTSVWFYVMSKFISNNSHKIKPRLLNKLNVATGVFLVVLGIGCLIKISSMVFN